METHDRLAQTVEQFCDWIAGLPPRALTQQAWGPREVLAHLAYYQELYVQHIQDQLAGRPLTLPKGTFRELNAAVARAAHTESPERLCQRLRAATQRLLELAGQHDPRTIAFPIKAGSQVWSLEKLLPAVESHIRGHLRELRKAERAASAASGASR